MDLPNLSKTNKALIFSKTPLLLFGAFFILLNLYVVYQLHWKGPFRDGWEFFWLYQSLFNQSLNSESVDALLTPYAGAHRLAITHIILAADWEWFSGKNYLPIFISLLCQFSLLLGAIYLFNKSELFDKSTKLVLGGLLAIILFNQSSVFSILYAFMVQLYLAVFLTFLSCYLFFKSKTGKFFYLLLVIPCFFSNFFSVAVVFIPGFYYLFNKKRAVSFICFSLALIAIYFYLPHNDNNNPNTNTPSILEIIYFLAALFLNYFHFILRYLSAPLSLQYPALGILVAGSSFFYVMYLFIYRIFSKKELNRLFDVYLCLTLITLFIAFSTAFGRFNPMAAMAERYQPAVIFYWFCFSQLVFLATTKNVIRILAIIFSLIIFLPSQSKIIDENIFLSEKVALANFSANLGISHVDAVRPVLSFPLNRAGINPLIDFNSLIAAKQKAYFSETSDILRNDLSCPLKTSTPRKLTLSKIFKNSEYQWYEVDLINSQDLGNIILIIDGRLFPGRIIKQSIWSNQSNKLYFIAPIDLKLNNEISYFSDKGVTCQIKY